MGLNVRLLRESFELVLEREPNITHRFYGILFSRYPQVKPLFGRNSQAQQEKMLAEALAAVIDKLEDASWLEEKLMAMGAKHVDYGVTDEMYPWVADALISALGEAAGADWTPEHHKAWSDALNAIASLMIRGAKQYGRPEAAAQASS
ncbi:flavohemoprotein [Sorangium cellulosum]|jgi:hemoglobin-like flavoprotein|uniref:Flavohemoprotein n=1 Tax=Sorangium cellulosum TaxID=56 RepID=A0A4P2Q5F7_SORCE|nr:globin domain-containing protein [Sorangium cellulosum]AUX24278.1 flavohemoprotein [Sorangium cellulosum]